MEIERAAARFDESSRMDHWEDVERAKRRSWRKNWEVNLYKCDADSEAIADYF